MTSDKTHRAENRSDASKGAHHPLLFISLTLLVGAGVTLVHTTGPEQVLAQSAGPVAITNTPSASSVASGGSLTYTIVVTNTGGAALSNVAVTDQVNGMTSLVLSASPGSCSQSAGNVTCAMPNGKSLGGGASWTVTIQGTVTAAAGTTLNDNATTSVTKSSQTFTASATTTVQITASTGGSLPDLTVSVNGPTSVVTNASFIYTLTVNNIGTANATGVEVDNTLPSGVSLVAPAPNGTNLFTCSPASGMGVTVKCTGGSVAAGANATITISVAAPSTTGTITDTATVDPTCSSATESNCANNNAQLSTAVVSPPPPALPDLTVSISAPTSVVVGASYMYALVVNNISTTTSAPASILEVDNTLPIGVTLVSASGSNGYTCGTSNPVVCTTATPLAAGANATIKITVTAPSNSGTIIDSATVDPTCTTALEISCSNNNASTSTVVTPVVTPGTLNLTVSAASTADPGGSIVAVPQDGKLTYSVVITNATSGRADDVVLTDTTQGLDAASITATPDAVSAAAGVTCAINAPTVTCSAKPPGWRIAAGGTATITITGSAVTSAGTLIAQPGMSLIDQATVTANISNVGQTASASVSTTVVPSIDLSITQSSSSSSMMTTPNAAHAAADLVYTMVVGNSGFYNATNVEVRNPLPGGVLQPKNGSGVPTFTFSDVSGAGFKCTIDASNVVDCTGGTVKGFGPSTHPKSNTVTITLSMVAPELTGAITTTAVVNPSHSIPESDFANNSNNSFTLTTVISPGVDLTVSEDTYCPLSVPPGPGTPPIPLTPVHCPTVATSGTLTYVIEVPNQGTQDTTGVLVRDTLPSGVTFLSGVGDHNFTCAQTTAPGVQPAIVDCTGGIITGTYTKDAPTLYPTYPSNFPPQSANEDVATIVIKVFAVPAPGKMTNQVRVDPSGTISEFDKTNNITSLDSSAAYGGPNAYIDLSISETQISPTTPPNQVAQNGTLTYQLTVTNNIYGPYVAGTGTPEGQQATNVAVRDFLPQGARFISAIADPLSPFPTNPTSSGGFLCSEAPAAGMVNTEEVDCAGGTIANGGSTTIRITMFAPPAGTYTTQALVDPNNAIAKGDQTNTTTSITTTTLDEVGTTGLSGNNAYIDLTLAMLADHGTGAAPYNKPSVVPGGGIAYTLTVTNLGSGTATNVEVKDTLPSGSTKFISAQDGTPASPGAFTCGQPVNGVVDCTGGTVTGNGGTRTIIIVVAAPNQTSDFTSQNSGSKANDITLTNQAIVNPSGSIPESTMTNNSALWLTTVHPNIDLSITKTGPGSAAQGDTVTYTITVTLKCDQNTADQPCLAQNVQVHDPFPVEIIPMGVATVPTGGSGSGNTLFSCQFAQNPVNVLDCSGDLVPGTGQTQVQVQITGTFFVTAQNGSLVEPNRACVDPNNLIVEQDKTNNCSTAPAFPVGFIDLTISKTGPSAAIVPGTPVTYTITVSNIGTLPTDGSTITITDNIGAAGLVPDVTQTPTLTGFTCNTLTAGTSGQTLTCTDTSAFAAGATATLTFTAELPTSSPPPSGPVSNTATVAGGGEKAQFTGNNSSTTQSNVQPPAIDLSVTKPQANPQQAFPSSTLTFTVPAANLGPQAATKSGGVTIQNTISFGGTDLNGLSYIGETSGGTNGWSCDATMSVSGGTGTVNCNNPNGMGPAGTQLSPSDTTLLTLRFVVGHIAAGSQITLTSTIDPNNVYPEDTNKSNNTASASVNMLAGCPSTCPDLTAAISVDQSAVTLHFSSGGATCLGIPCYIDSATLKYAATIADANAASAINPSGGGAGNGAVWVFFTPDPNLTYAWAGATVTGAFTLTGHTPTCYAPGSVPAGANAPAGAAACNFDLNGSSAATINFSATAPTSIFAANPYPSPGSTKVDISATNSPDPSLPDVDSTATATTTVTTVVVP